MHPAAAGWAFASLSWPQLMNRFSLPDFLKGPLLGGRPSVDAFGQITTTW